MQTCPRCADIFIDIENYIYCSLDTGHQVLRKWLNNQSDLVQIVAGTGKPGSTPNVLYYPWGLFVDTNSDLYVADQVNHRIQLFRLGQSNAITVAGSGSSINTIALFLPTAIVLDANKYLFIVEHENHRIVGSGPNGFRCLVGCHGGGSAANELNSPTSMSFDTFGNLFVVDQDNHRIQKFTSMSNSCSKFDHL